LYDAHPSKQAQQLDETPQVLARLIRFIFFSIEDCLEDFAPFMLPRPRPFSPPVAENGTKRAAPAPGAAAQPEDQPHVVSDVLVFHRTSRLKAAALLFPGKEEMDSQKRFSLLFAHSHCSQTVDIGAAAPMVGAAEVCVYALFFFFFFWLGLRYAG
jgi:hypothetical protein